MNYVTNPEDGAKKFIAEVQQNYDLIAAEGYAAYIQGARQSLTTAVDNYYEHNGDVLMGFLETQAAQKNMNLLEFLGQQLSPRFSGWSWDKNFWQTTEFKLLLIEAGFSEGMALCQELQSSRASRPGASPELERS